MGIYKYINLQIRLLNPQNYYKNFNIGVSTGKLSANGLDRKILDKYRHWCYFKSEVSNNLVVKPVELAKKASDMSAT